MVGELEAGDPRSAGPYRLLGRLGAGGMGQVFLGRSATGALVAVKVIRPELAEEPGFRARFAREVAAAANVSGRFTALVLDADVESATPWLATAYVAGPSLAQAVTARGALAVPAVLRLGSGLAQGLRAIHAAGLVHRDLKPANVLLASDGPRVIDFGISRSREASMLTATGMVVGSPGFMSPEQAVGRNVGPRSDVFSLGAVLAFAATARHPFGTGTAPMLMYRAVHDEPDISLVPRELVPLVAWCLAKDPGQRPGTAELLGWMGSAARPVPATSRHRAPARAPAARCGPAPAAAGAAGPALASAFLAAPVLAAPVLAAPVLAGDPALADAFPAAPVPDPPRAAPTAAESAALAPTITACAIRAVASQPAGAHRNGPPGRPSRRRLSRWRLSQRRLRRSRRRLIWALAVTGAAAAVAGAAILPGALGGTAAAQPRPHLSAVRGPAGAAAGTAPGARAPADRPAAAASGPSLSPPALAARLPARPASPSPSASAAPSAPPAAPSSGPAPVRPGPAVPLIISSTSYMTGAMVYLSLTYTDPGNDAAGFGLVGVNGTNWPAQSHPLAEPGVVRVGIVAYPFDLACGTAGAHSGTVQAWIYDTAGDRSQPVTVALACSG
jgi:eukaryotic-like serine/threonine-protein kinase